jgi:deferrochelatase/peroxidase EfeB
MSKRISRRTLLAAAGAGGAALALGGGVAAERTRKDEHGASSPVPFDGAHQAGIATPVQDRLHFASFDVVGESRKELEALLAAWTVAARQMTAGELVGRVSDEPSAPPDDTGEAVGLHPSRLTLTFGFGPTLFGLDGRDRFGLAVRRPAALVELPPFPGDSLDPERSGGDLCVQACADDPQVAFHAVRNLTRIARGTAVMRWSQLGFGRTSSTSRSQETARNLMGFKDGTNNIESEDRAGLNQHVWVGSDDADWLRGGSYLVARRIRILIETWDRASLDDQERTIGRTKVSGAPLGAAGEFDDVDLAAKGADGTPAIPLDAHIRLAAPTENAGARILRRGYSFTDGMDQRLGQLDAGLFFLAYMRRPSAFVELQRRLGRSDALNEYITHNGSALFACPPGTTKDGTIGETLFT